MKSLLIYLISVILLSVFGFVISGTFIETSISLLDLSNIQIVESSIQNNFKQRLFFASALDSIPLFLFVIRKCNRIQHQSIKTAWIACSLILFFGMIAWQFRIYQLNLKFDKFSILQINDAIDTTISFNALSFSFYLFLGFIIGAFLSIVVLKRVVASQKLQESDAVL